MRALIVGGNGAIGSAIARHADAVGIETHVGLRSVDAPERLAVHRGIHRHALDTTEIESVRRVVAAVRPDWITMAAFPRIGHASGAQASGELLRWMSSSLPGVIEGARMAGFRGALTWIGSAMSYGETGRAWNPGVALRPTTLRGAVKAAESLLAPCMAMQSGIALTEIRVFTGYGPYEQRERLVASLLRAALTNGRVRLATTPTRRDWIHYDDIASACVASAGPRAATARVFNACTGCLHDARQVASLLEDITGKSLVADEPYEYDDPYGNPGLGQIPDAAAGLDWTPRYDLAHGLAQSWEWARSEPGRAYLLASPIA